MGCGQKAAQDREDEEIRKRHNIECRKLVRSFSPTELGNLLFDLLYYFEMQRDHNKQTKYGFEQIDKYIERIKNEQH